MRSWARNSSVANRIRTGTRRSNTGVGVTWSSAAPMRPPVTLGSARIRNRRSATASSRLKPQTPPTVPGQIATVLVAFAVTDGRPSQTRVGKVRRVPPPAMELMAPARKAAAKAASSCVRQPSMSFDESPRMGVRR
jgi:hypothetical protein